MGWHRRCPVITPAAHPPLLAAASGGHSRLCGELPRAAGGSARTQGRWRVSGTPRFTEGASPEGLGLAAEGLLGSRCCPGGAGAGRRQQVPCPSPALTCSACSPGPGAQVDSPALQKACAPGPGRRGRGGQGSGVPPPQAPGHPSGFRFLLAVSSPTWAIIITEGDAERPVRARQL